MTTKEILGNDGNIHIITASKYHSYKNSKLLTLNEQGVEVLNIFVDTEEEQEMKDFEEFKNRHKDKEEKDQTTKIEAERLIKLFPEVHRRIFVILDTFMVMKDQDKKIVALWIIGTYFHKEFNSFPRLFINAMKGSGKSRLLQIIKALAWNGSVQANLTEAVLFRSASESTLLFDESESISSKEKGVMRELLNAGYKKGVAVSRLKKVKTKEGEEMAPESFDLYGPVGLANINGVEDVLADRALTLILEKSNDPIKTKLLEDFDKNDAFLDIKRTLEAIRCRLCSVGTLKNNLHQKDLIEGMNIHTLTYTHTHNTLPTLPTPYSWEMMTLDKKKEEIILSKEAIAFYDKVTELGIEGRDLELFLPLFVIADWLKGDILSQTMIIAKDYVENKQQEDHIENRDWSLVDFVARYPSTLNFIPVAKIVNDFRDFYNDDDVEWLNSAWIGKSLRRLNLTVDKRRLGKGVEYILNGAKAKAQMEAFRK